MTMQRKRFRWRRLIFVALSVWIVLILLRSFLSSSRLSLAVATRLGAAYGGEVSIDATEVGLESSVIHGVCLFEEGDDKAGTPWATIQEASCDLVVWDLLSEESQPHQLQIRGAEILLRFDDNGHLLTRIPKLRPSGKPLPDIEFVDAVFILRQTGHPDLLVRRVNAAAHANEATLKMDGRIADPIWGQWYLSGTADPSAAKSHFTLVTNTRHVNQKILESVPFVPAKVWQAVQCEGETHVMIELDLADSLRYRIGLEPRQTKVYIPSIDLRAEQASGKIIVEDKTVRLVGVHGKTADGEIKTESFMDFRQKSSSLKFAVEVAGCDSRKLPKKWSSGLSTPFHGRVSGKGDLVVNIEDGKAQAHGKGNGTLSDVHIGGLKIGRSIPLHFQTK